MRDERVHVDAACADVRLRYVPLMRFLVRKSEYLVLYYAFVSV